MARWPQTARFAARPTVHRHVKENKMPFATRNPDNQTRLASEKGILEKNYILPDCMCDK